MATPPAHQVPTELRDFRNYLFLCWKHLGLPEPTPVQYDIAHYLQHGPRRSGTQAFRGVGKSWITGAFVTWRLYLNPNEWIMVVSAGQDRATQFSQFVKRLIDEWPLLAHLKARPGQRTSNLGFDVGPARTAQSPSVKSVGITGQITGSRATLIIPDDVEVPSNSDTVTKREKLAELIKEFDAVLVPNGEVKYLGTPQTEESIYYKILPQRGYDLRVWPARVPSLAQAERYGKWLAPSILAKVAAGNETDQSTDPKRFTDADLTERELSYGRSGFQLQFMLNPSVSDQERYPLKLRDLSVMTLDARLAPVQFAWGSSSELKRNDLPLLGFSGDHYHKPFFIAQEFSPYQGAVMFIDPAGRGKDELGYAIVKMLNGNLFLTACKGMTGGYSPENLKALALAAKAHSVKVIRIESNFGDGMFEQLLKPVLAAHYPCTTEEIRSSTQKEKRLIDTLEPVLNQHRLIVDERVIKEDHENYNGHALEKAREYSLFYQLTHITKDRGALKHDDRLDALAGAVAYWVEVMAKNDTASIDEHKEAALKADLEDYMAHALGARATGDLWVQAR